MQNFDYLCSIIPEVIMIRIKHNIDESKFKFLWAKYVEDGKIDKHCAQCLKGHWSKKFSGAWNKDLPSQPVLEMNEFPEGSFKAIYFCGVAKSGYPKTCYPHNLHFAVIPEDGASDTFDFEDWHVEIEGGRLSEIPTEDQLDGRFSQEPYNEHYYTCRIFRWMLGFFYPETISPSQPPTQSA